MAIFHLNAAIISRGKNQSVIAAAAYEARERIKSEQDNKTRNYAYKGGLIDKGIALPEGAAEWMGDRATLWNAVEHKENESKHWRTAQLARRFIYSVPAELSQAEQVALTKEIAESLARRGMVVDYAIHAPDKEGDERNTHAHFITTLRDVKDGQFQNKHREWNDKEYLKELRADICDITNQHLKKYGIQVDHRSYEEQGIEKEPTQHKGVNIVAHERRLKRVSKELQRKESEAAREALAIAGDIMLEENIKKLSPQTAQRSEIQKPAVTKPEPLPPRAVENIPKPQEKPRMKFEPPKTKNELFVNVMCDNRSLIGTQLLAEADDLVNRSKKMQKGVTDEAYQNDKRIFETTRKAYNEVAEATRDEKDYPKWRALFGALGIDSNTGRPYGDNFTYKKYRFQLMKNIDEAYERKSKELFSEERKQAPEQKQQQERKQTRGRGR